MSNDSPKTDDKFEDPVLELSKISFAKHFFEALDEQVDEQYRETGGIFPDWKLAIARAKLEGVVPLHGSGSRVMATIPSHGVIVTACHGDCLFRLDACNCNGLDHDMCSHPDAPLDLILTKKSEPPEKCPMRKAVFHVALSRRYCVDLDE